MPRVSIVGNVARAPELRFTGAGTPSVRFAVAENAGYRDRTSGEWVEEDPTFWDVTVWGESAKNVADSVALGARVVVLGRTRTNRWETPEGEKRSRVEVTAEEVAVSLRYAVTPQVVKVTREAPAGAAAPVPAGAPF